MKKKYSLKIVNIFVFTLFINLTFSQTTLYSNGFEGTDEDTYNLTNSVGGDVNIGTLNGTSDYILRGNPASNTYIDVQPTGYSGNVLMWEDFDGYIGGSGELQITTNSIDISTYGDIEISLKFGVTNDATTRYENLDYFIIEYDLDNSNSWIQIGDFQGQPTGMPFNFYEDDNLDGNFTVQTTNAMRTLTYNLDSRAGSSVTGTSLRMRIRAFSGIQEEMVIDDLSVVANTTLSISDNELERNVSFYPNPNNGKFTLNYKGAEALTGITVLDITGKTIQSLNFESYNSNYSIDLTHLVKGMYFVKIEANNTIATKRVIIE